MRAVAMQSSERNYSGHHESDQSQTRAESRPSHVIRVCVVRDAVWSVLGEEREVDEAKQVQRVEEVRFESGCSSPERGAKCGGRRGRRSRLSILLIVIIAIILIAMIAIVLY